MDRTVPVVVNQANSKALASRMPFSLFDVSFEPTVLSPVMLRSTLLLGLWLFGAAAAWSQDATPSQDGPSNPVDPSATEAAAGTAGSTGASVEQTPSDDALPILAPVEDPSSLQEGMQWLSRLLRVRVGDNSFSRIVVSFVILLGALLLRRALLVIFFSRLRRLTSLTKWKYDDQVIEVLEAPVGAFVLVIGIFLAVATLSIPPEIDVLALRAFQAASMTVAFWGFLRVVDVAADILEDLARGKGMAIYAFVPLLKKAARVFLIIIGVILVIQNLGYSVGSLLAGLGIGGLAVALAAQESLGNFFGSISIAADRPFKVGDWVQVGDKIDGDVEEVGLRSTKVRTWAKSQLTIPNKVLANEVIENWSRMPKRRVKQVVGVTYETSAEDMEGLVGDVRRLLREDPDVHQDFILVNFIDFGASSLDILVYYFTVSTKWLVHMDVRQRINLKIMRAIKARGLSVAFPTRTIYFEGDIARQLSTRAPG